MNTHQATYETALERFERRMAERDARMAERDARMAERDSALVDRIATATDRMASSRWWQTAILLAGIGIFMGVATTAIIYFLPG
ncbi:MAG: hypothetical protein F4Z55_13820 [Boseongicola sp. SB0667_bin_21]|nr:hypothetical protein [Boseongicola sp. SB0667_bin_21]